MTIVYTIQIKQGVNFQLLDRTIGLRMPKRPNPFLWRRFILNKTVPGLSWCVALQRQSCAVLCCAVRSCAENFYMARLIRPLRQWPQLHQHCCSRTPANHLLSSIIRPTLTAKNSWSYCLCLTATSVASSRRNVHRPSRGLIRPDALTTSDPKEGGNTSDSDSELKKSRNQKKREAKRAVRWGMKLAAFSTSQIKRILKYNPSFILLLKLTPYDFAC